MPASTADTAPAPKISAGMHSGRIDQDQQHAAAAQAQRQRRAQRRRAGSGWACPAAATAPARRWPRRCRSNSSPNSGAARTSGSAGQQPVRQRLGRGHQPQRLAATAASARASRRRGRRRRAASATASRPAARRPRPRPGAIWRSVCGSGPTPSGNRLTATMKKAIGSSASTRRRAASRRSRATMVVNDAAHRTAYGIELQGRRAPGRAGSGRCGWSAPRRRRARHAATSAASSIAVPSASSASKGSSRIHTGAAASSCRRASATRRRWPCDSVRTGGVAAAEQADATQRRARRPAASPAWPCSRARNCSASSTVRSSFSALAWAM